MFNQVPPDLKPGDGLGLAFLNGTAAAARANATAFDANSGMTGGSIPGVGSYAAAIPDPEGWFRVVSNDGGGNYTLREIVPVAGGGWADAPRVVTEAREAGDSTVVPATKRVYALYMRASWRFQWGACPS